MATQPFRYYRFRDVNLSIGGRRIQEFGEDGEISFDYLNDLVEIAGTADGTPVFSENSTELMLVTVTVMQTGTGYKQLAELVNLQKRTPVNAFLVPFLLKNEAQGDLVVSPWTVFLNRVPLTLGRTAGTAEFRMALPYSALTAAFGVNN